MPTKIASVIDEYSKDEKLKPDDVRILIEWMEKQNHLPKISEMQIILFLQSCYYSIESAKICMEKYFTIRYRVPELFKNRNPSSLRNINRTLLMARLPYFEPNNIFYVKLIDSDVEQFDYAATLKLMDVRFSLTCRQFGTFPKHLLVLDADGLSLGHLLRVNLMLARKGLTYLQEALPARLTELHVINSSSCAEKYYVMLKPFLSAKLVNMIQFHSTLKEFFEHVPQKCMPDEYGGNAGTFRELNEEQIMDIETNAEFLEHEELLVTDESKRMGKSDLGMKEIFGSHGTFRKLDID